MATVSSDRLDYQPGDTALFTADGLDLGQTITFEVSHLADAGEDGIWGTGDDLAGDDSGGGHAPWTVTDGGFGDLDGLVNGSITTTWYVNPDDSLDATFVVTASATDAAGETLASAVFTDTHLPSTGATVELLHLGEIGSINGAWFQQSAETGSSGTGTLDSFLRIQANGTEQGYNTDAALQFDEKAGAFTESKSTDLIPLVYKDFDDDGNLEAYRELRLDINESSNAAGDQYLSLDALQVYLVSSPDATGFTAPTILDNGTYSAGGFGDATFDWTLIYDMDAGAGDQWIALNAALQAGSGNSVDMVFYLPDELFDGFSYFVLYSAFGYQGDETGTAPNWSSSGGFEEWAIRLVPSMTVTKTADVTSVDGAGDQIVYTYTIENTGNVELTGISIVDDAFTPGVLGDDVIPTLVGGDTDGDGKLDTDEVWTYTYTHTVTQDEMDAGLPLHNVVTADSQQTDPVTDDETVTITQNPAMTIEKTFDGFEDGDPEGDEDGDVLNYTVKVTNTGNITLTGVTVSDPLVSNLAYVSGDTDEDGKLDVGEEWTYTGTYTLTQDDLDDRGGGDDDIDNTATAGSDQTDDVTASADAPLDYSPAMTIDKVTVFGSLEGDGLTVSAGQTIGWKYTLTNTGNITLTNITVVDDMGTVDTTDDHTFDTIESLAVGESITLTHSGTAVAGYYENVATADSDETGAVTDNSWYTSSEGPGARTPGFWKNWTAVWDGNSGNDGRFAGRDFFPDSDILLPPYSVSGGPTDPVTGTQSMGILIGDMDFDGITDEGENTIFYTYDEAFNILKAPVSIENQDARYILTKQLIATWLNGLAGNPYTMGPKSVMEDIDNAVEWLQNHTADEDGDGLGDGDLTIKQQAGVNYRVKSSDVAWNGANDSLDGSESGYGAAIKDVLEFYNTTGAGIAVDGDTGFGTPDLEGLLATLQTYQSAFENEPDYLV